MKRYEAYLFDCDGTLIDTTDLICECFRYSCKRWGDIEVPPEQVVPQIGLPLRRQFEVFLGPVEPRRMEEIVAAHMRYQLSIYPQYLRLCGDAADGLRALAARGGRCGVVTSRYPETLRKYLGELGILDCMEVLVTPVDTPRHKPDPDPVVKALELMSVAADRAIYVGDSSWDIECGRNAGVDTALVAWSRADPETLTVRPTYYIKTITELAEWKGMEKSPHE